MPGKVGPDGKYPMISLNVPLAQTENNIYVLDVSLAVNLCINCNFLHLYLQFYYISELLQQNCLLDCLHELFVLTMWWTKLATRQLFTAR